MTSCDLGGAAVLVTRPADRAAHLAQALRDLGAEPVLFPGIDIEALPQTRLLPALALLPTAHWIIFVSPTAARIGMQAIAAAGGIPAATKVAAIGSGTAIELRKNGVDRVVTPPAGADSQSLAASPELGEVDGKRVLIVRGEGGRDVLARTLKRRGAEVTYVECYRRNPPMRNAGEFQALWRSRAIAAWTATSAEIVDNLFRNAGDGGRPWLCRTPLFVPHPRIAATAFRLAVDTIFVTAPGDAGLVAGLATWFCRLRPAMIGNSDTP